MSWVCLQCLLIKPYPTSSWGRRGHLPPDSGLATLFLLCLGSLPQAVPCPGPGMAEREPRGFDLYRVSLQQYPPTRPYHSNHSVPRLFPFPHRCPRKDRGGSGLLLVEEARAQPRITWEAGSSAGMVPKDGSLPGRQEAALPHACTSLD